MIFGLCRPFLWCILEGGGWGGGRGEGRERRTVVGFEKKKKKTEKGWLGVGEVFFALFAPCFFGLVFFFFFFLVLFLFVLVEKRCWLDCV